MEHYSEQEVTMLNESKQKKRDSDSANNENKKVTKRRSSLAATRRSITGNVAPIDDPPSSSGSSTFSDSDKQNSNLKPNPQNVRMDEIIEQFEENISRLDKEYAQWKLALTNLGQEQEQTKLLSECNHSIQAEDIPQEIKDFARSEYITCELMDFGAMESRVEKRLLKTHFNIEKCLQDMKLLRGTVNTISCHNKLMKASLINNGNSTDPFGVETPDSQWNSIDSLHDRNGDIKSQLEWLMNN